MANTTFKIERSSLNSKNIMVTFSAEKFERIAAEFGLFRKEFLDSLDRAEEDVRLGRTRKIKSLVSLRK